MAANGGCHGVDWSRSGGSTLPAVEEMEGMEEIEEMEGMEGMEGDPVVELLSNILGRLSIRLIGTIRSVFAEV